MTAETRDRLVGAARIVAGEGLSDAFGHVSARVADDRILISPPLPLGTLRAEDPFAELTIKADALPDQVPKEGWIHSAIAALRPEIGAVVRAQPRAVAALAASGHPLRPLHGHGAFLGDPVPVHDDSRLIRDPESAARVAVALGEGSAIILRGNGAVTAAPTLEAAVALMWVLERSAELSLTALATGGSPVALPAEEQEWWVARGPELMPRIYRYLETIHKARP